MRHLTLDELEAGLDLIRQSPADAGTIDLIVARPAVDARTVLVQGWLDLEGGLQGDGWSTRGSKSTPDGSSDPRKQITVINARLSALVAVDADRRPLAGDQLHVDLDLGVDNLTPGTRLHIGAAVIEVSDQPHRGCKKFAERFGHAALRFVNSEAGEELRLRGVNCRVIVAGTVRTGDSVRVERPARAAEPPAA